MNIADELGKVREKIDSIIAWARGGGSYLDLERAPRRLKMFISEYQNVFGTFYQPRDAKVEAGAAKRTEAKVGDMEYLAAMREYLADRPSAFGASYLKFAGKIDHWLNVVRGKDG